MSDRASQKIPSKSGKESGMSNYSNAIKITGANIMSRDVISTPNTGACQRTRPIIKMNNLIPEATESQHSRGGSLTVQAGQKFNFHMNIPQKRGLDVSDIIGGRTTMYGTRLNSTKNSHFAGMKKGSIDKTITAGGGWIYPSRNTS